MPPEGAAAAAAGAAGPFRKLRTSSWVTRPFSPVPLTLVRSMPSSRASRRTDGLACTPAKLAPAAPPAACGWGEKAGGGAGCWRGCGSGSCWPMTEGGGVTGARPRPPPRRP